MRRKAGGCDVRNRAALVGPDSDVLCVADAAPLFIGTDCLTAGRLCCLSQQRPPQLDRDLKSTQ